MLFAACCLLMLPSASIGQSLSLSLSATNNAPNNCSPRTISVSVSGGSGNYAYYWSSQPPSSVQLGNGPSITVSPSSATTYTVAVVDNSTSQYAEKSILISPLLSGSFNTFIPNAFFEGYLWRVLDSGQGFGLINAYRYELSIKDNWGNQVYSASRTVSSGTQGLVGGEISWNGRLWGTGNYVPAGDYLFDLRLINCSQNILYRFVVTFFRPLLLAAYAYPNPAQDYLELNLLQEEEPSGKAMVMPASLEAEAKLLNLRGQEVLRESITQFPTRLDVRALPEEDYLLVLQIGERTIRQRLLIRR